MGFAQGPDVVIDAMLVALAITAPNANVLLGFVIPIRAKTIVYIAIAIELISALLTGASTLSISLGGMAMGYLLTTGNWRPERLRNLLAHLLWQQKLKKRRKDFYVVPPDEKTFH
jgi:membrane associated rhomboid family serine protease